MSLVARQACFITERDYIDQLDRRAVHTFGMLESARAAARPHLNKAQEAVSRSSSQQTSVGSSDQGWVIVTLCYHNGGSATRRTEREWQQARRRQA